MSIWRRAARPLRVLVFILGALAAVAMAAASLAVLYARSEGGRARVRALLLAQAHRTLPGLAIARLGGDYVHDLVLDDVTVLDHAGRRAIHVDRVAVRFDLLPLLRRTVHVRELRIEAPVLLGRPEVDGALNLTRLTAPGPAPPAPAGRAGPAAASPWRVHVDRVQVIGGAADVMTADGERALLSGLALDGAAALDGPAAALSVHGLALRAERDGRVHELELGGWARIDAGAVAITLSRLHVTGLLSHAGEAGDAIDVTARASGPRARMAVAVTMAAGPAGHLGLRGTVGLAAPSHDGETTLGDYDLALDAADLVLPRLVPAAPEGRLSLSLTARGRGLPLAPGSRAAVALEVPPARLGGIDIDRVRLVASSDGPRWQVSRALVRAAGVVVTLAGHGAGGDLEADLEADLRGGLHGGGRSPLPALRGRGHLALHLVASLPQRAELSARIEARRIASGAFRVGAARLDARGSARRLAAGAPLDHLALDARGSLANLATGATRIQDLTLATHATGTPAAPRGTLRLGARGVRAGAGAPRMDTLTLEATSDGGDIRVRGAAAGPRLRAGLEAHGQAQARLAHVSVDRLSLAFETRAYKQTLALQRPTTVDFRAGDRLALAPTEVRGAGYLLTGTVVAGGELRLEPSRRGPLGALSLELRRASLVGFDAIDATLRARLEPRRATANLDATLARARLHLDADLPVVVPRAGGPRLAARGPIAVHVTTQSIKLQELPVLQRMLARQGLSGGTLDAALTLDGDVAQPRATARLDLRDAMVRNVAGLGRDSTLKTIPGAGVSLALDSRPGSIHVASTLLLRRTGVLRVDARSRIELGDLIAGASIADAPMQATIDIPSFELQSLGELAEVCKGITGTLAGHMEVRGTPRRPSGRADLTVTGAGVDQVRFRHVLLHGDAEDGRIDLALNLTEASGGILYATARLERGRGDALTGTLGIKDVDVGLARPFLPGVREVGGILQASARVTGTLAAPVVRGSLALARGRLGLIGQPTFQDVTLAASLRPGRADLERLGLRSGGGTLTGKGWAVLDGLAPESVVLTAHASHFLVAAAGSTGARLDGDLAAEAALREAVVAGRVRVPRAVIWLPRVGGSGARDLQKIGQHPDLRFVDPAAQAAAEKEASRRRDAAAQPRRLDLTAQAGPVYVRSKDLDLELDSTLYVATAGSGPHAGQPALTGSVRIRRGRMNISGQRFDFERGDISFDGSPSPDPALDIRLGHQYPDAAVAIEIRGTPRHPQLRLTSDPPIYDQAQIVSLILTGQPGGQPSTGKSFDPTAAVATMVLGKLADKVAPGLGLDVLRVENVEQKTPEGQATGDTDTRVEVGKYISDRVYLSYAHVFGAPENANLNEAHVEYRLTRRWMVETVFGDAGAGGVDALWTYRY